MDRHSETLGGTKREVWYALCVRFTSNWSDLSDDAREKCFAGFMDLVEKSGRPFEDWKGRVEFEEALVAVTKGMTQKERMQYYDDHVEGHKLARVTTAYRKSHLDRVYQKN